MVEGLKQAIFNIGYLATVLILFRYINVVITFNSATALVILVAINYIFSIKFLICSFLSILLNSPNTIMFSPILEIAPPMNPFLLL